MKKVTKAIFVSLLVFTMIFGQAFQSPASALSFKDLFGWMTSITTKKNNKNNDTKTELVEDETTVKEGIELRASTYEATNESTNATSTLKYFPVTMYDYDKDTMNNATHKLEVENALKSESGLASLTKWNGVYFGNMNTSSHSYTGNVETPVATTSWTPIALSDIDPNETYVIVGYRGQALTGNDNYTSSSITGTATGANQGATITSPNNIMDGATKWTIKRTLDGNYTISANIGNSTKYITIGNATGGLIPAENNLTITPGEHNNSFYIGQNGYYLNQYEGASKNVYKGWNGQDEGSEFYIYKLSTTTNNTVNTSSLRYATYNWWTGQISNNDLPTSNKSGNQTYSGIVKSELDANKNIQFNYPEAGIFTSSTANKSVYTNVGIPFVYTDDDGYYTFDANKHGAYFHEDANQEGTSSTPQSNVNLYYSETPQTHDYNAEDGRHKGWFPYNDSTNIKGYGSNESNVTADQGKSKADYYFGMNATFPFTMTSNGRMNVKDRESEPIKFEFSGDDDVWVFIDGKLVLDIGGERNCLDGEIDFANNTYAITKTVGNGGGELGDAATSNNSNLSGKLFNDSEGEGVLGTTRENFAATDSHDLTVFYLERGAGSSNCKIRFNLPVKDSVSVQKLVRETDSKDVPINPEIMDQINNRDFTFTLYRDTEPVANTPYNVLNENGQYIKSAFTDGSGKFTLKNKQTAKFIGQITSDENNPNSYYIVEDVEDKEGTAWEVPHYTNEVNTAHRHSITDSTVNGQSMIVTASGSDEAEDSISFVCKNTLTHEDDTTLEANDDRIVIDYGLPVEIDVLQNDVVQKGIKSIESVSEAKYGTAEIKDGKIVYKLNKQLTGVEVLTYTVKATSTGGTTDDDKTADAKVYIMPATTMYYEENFSDMVKYDENDDWQPEKLEPQTEPQEPGVIGTADDSPYGSDVVYKNNSGDSYGTSMYVNTASNSAQFSYEFTGTGTSFFARTTNNSGYMRVVVSGESGSKTYYRNTVYKTDDNNTTLYNIPVFTAENLDYGKYTVTVTIANSNGGKYGSDFWLDGIRVVNPINKNDPNYPEVTSAYARDNESNMQNVTLRKKLLSVATDKEDGTIDWTSAQGYVVFTDTNGEITSAEEYKSIGPKEEVYLANDQSVSFSIENWDPNVNKLYLGIKAPMGNGKVKINNAALQINNTTDCYYDISQFYSLEDTEDGKKIVTFKITADTPNIIALTNIKVTGAPNFVIIPSKNENMPDFGDGDVDMPGSGDDDDEDITVESESENTTIDKAISKENNMKE